MNEPSPTPLEWEVAAQCDVCGATGWRPSGAFRGRRYGRCERCGVVRLVDRVAESHLAAIYANYYAPRDLSPADLEEQLANPTFAHRRKRIEAALGSRERHIFEIGCGDGNFLASLQRHGWKVDGFEVGTSTVALVRQRHGITITDVDVVQHRPASAPYPVVAAYHVLEHVYRPAGWLAHVRDLIEPQGLLHLQVPNWDSLTHALSGMAWFSVRFPKHVYFYTPATLTAFLSRCGFEVVSATTWDPWHGPGAATSSMIARGRNLLTGRPANGESSVDTGAAATVPAARETRRPGVSHRAVQLAGHAAARIEAFVGRGAVVDIIATRVE
jgi:2-polyprenyl-3-methyl-5-hydroxy-6-metoxy-1,4-benzoquinol methylase